MIKEERLNLILEHLTKDRKVLLSELSSILNVSEDTVRRDIKSLSERGLLKAVRGGAIPHSTGPRHFRAREHYATESKNAIASKALQFLEDDQVILFDGGTSTLAVAAGIPSTLQLTVVTNSFPIVSILEDHPKIELIFAGGRLDKDTFTAMGLDTHQTFRRIRADICFFGICSIHPTLGVTTVAYEEAAIKRTMVEMSKRTIALSTIEKMNKADPYYVCPISAIDTIVTDTHPDRENWSAFEQAGVHLL